MPGRLGKSQVQQGKGPSRAVSGRTPFNGKAKAFVEGKGVPVLLVAVDLPDAEPFDGMPDKPCAYALPEAFRPNKEHFKLPGRLQKHLGNGVGHGMPGDAHPLSPQAAEEHAAPRRCLPAGKFLPV